MWISRAPAMGNFNPRPPCGGRRYQGTWECRVRDISIHAPRVGGDLERVFRRMGVTAYFNPRPPCGGRHPTNNMRIELDIFQSTPPVWGATRGGDEHPWAKDISIHAPRVGGDDLHPAFLNSTEISIHAPRVGGDRISDQGEVQRQTFQSTPPVWGATFMFCTSSANRLFQSTPPVWGATFGSLPWSVSVVISIHAPRVGGDGGCSLAARV